MTAQQTKGGKKKKGLRYFIDAKIIYLNKRTKVKWPVNSITNQLFCFTGIFNY